MAEREIMRFTTSPEEIGEMMLHLGRQVYGAKKQKRSIAGSFLIWVFVGLIASLVLAGFGKSGLPFGAAFVSDFWKFGVGAMCAFGVTLVWLSRFQRQRLFDTLRQTRAAMDVTIIEGDDGLLWQTANQSHFVSWDLFDEVSTLNGGFFLRAGLIGFLLPSRAFKTVQEREELKTLLRQQLPPALLGYELLTPSQI